MSSQNRALKNVTEPDWAQPPMPFSKRGLWLRERDILACWSSLPDFQIRHHGSWVDEVEPGLHYHRDRVLCKATGRGCEEHPLGENGEKRILPLSVGTGSQAAEGPLPEFWGVFWASHQLRPFDHVIKHRLSGENCFGWNPSFTNY